MVNKLFYTKRGEGSNPALFLHGLGGGGNYLRELNFSRLPFSPQYFPDELGFGKSSKPNVTYTPSLHTRYIKNILPKNDPITILGNSFGSILSLHFAKRYPEKVERLILISPILYQDQKESTKHLSTKLIPRLTIKYPKLIQIFCNTLCSTGVVSKTAHLYTVGNRKKILQESMHHTWHSYYSTFNECIIKQSNYSLVHEVAHKTPIFILFGENDTYINPEALKNLASKNITVVALKNEGHDILYNNLPLGVDHILNWLNVNNKNRPK